MKAETLWHQGAGSSKDEWRLQRRSWGTWLVGIFFLAFVISEHPVFSSLFGFSITEAANTWADRVMVIGSFVAILTVPFTLDRARRQRVAPIEFSKPFERLAYVLGKFVGAILPLGFATLLSLVIHFGITWVSLQNISFIAAGLTYLNQAVFLALVPLLYAVSLIYCLSVYISRPDLIIPLYLFYLQMSSLTQAAANVKFSWWSPMVRPDYFSYEIPVAMTSAIWAHQTLYLVLSIIALALAVYGFQRMRFVEGRSSLQWWRRIRFSLPTKLGVQVRILWGGQMVAALVMAFFAIMNTLGNPQTDPILLAEYALFGLEFWLAISGLLILTGVIARDKGVGTVDLVLTKPINRWRLLNERLLPALTFYVIFCVFSVFVLRTVYEQLPIPKALIVSLSTGVYLGLVGMTVANITKNELAGYGAGLLYWLFEAGLDGRFTAPFYLFIVSNQVDNPALEIWDSPLIWLPVKTGLLFLAMWLFLINGWLLDPGPARRRAILVLVVSFPLIFMFGWWLMPMLI
jgi:ABC-type transport system involved in multi-copper enzyme maturation permease subunit